MEQQTVTYPLPSPTTQEDTLKFFNERQQRADRDAFKRILTHQGGQEPCEGDELVIG
ncbi:hypothetical protein [Thiothrix unzii]|uniref:Uncharacterized protein n=1 Tax=Thiothrix unzii TaxID=111769 RepID=A0A975IJI2_9GAMM|nr:hypothetical protein [Thiothrix unzii]QTR55145.1 hypothetical protein J9260_08725 [Thiothrix unzii]